MSAPKPTSRPYAREKATGWFWYGKWSRKGKPEVRALGRAWVESDGERGWRPRRGRAPEGVLTEAQANERMLELVREHHAEQTKLETDADARRRLGVTFRELAHEWLGWLADVKDAAPATLRDHRSVLAEPGTPYRRGRGVTNGLVMDALGDRPAREITTREISKVLSTIAATGVSPRTVNKKRGVISRSSTTA